MTTATAAPTAFRVNVTRFGTGAGTVKVTAVTKEEAGVRAIEILQAAAAKRAAVVAASNGPAWAAKDSGEGFAVASVRRSR